MAVINKNGLTIYPENWVDSFGDRAFNGRDERLKAYLKRAGPAGPFGKGKPYGWTVGVKLPTMERVKEAIEELKVGT